MDHAWLNLSYELTLLVHQYLILQRLFFLKLFNTQNASITEYIQTNQRLGTHKRFSIWGSNLRGSGGGHLGHC